MGTSLEVWVERLSKSCKNMLTNMSVINIVINFVFGDVSITAGSFSFICWTHFPRIFLRGFSWSWNLLSKKSRLQHGSEGTSETCQIRWCSGEVKLMLRHRMHRLKKLLGSIPICTGLDESYFLSRQLQFGEFNGNY